MPDEGRTAGGVARGRTDDAPPAFELRASGLEKSFGPAAAAVAVLRGLDLTVRGGESVAVTGASGSGKSTLLHVVGGMLRPDGGVVEVAGVRPWDLRPAARAGWRNSQVGFVFQFHHLLPELTALENVLAPTWIGGSEPAAARAAATDLLTALGLADRLHGLPSELSGGEAQRVAIARALARRPRLVLADEPTGNLDKAAGARVFEQFAALQREHRFVLIVATHDRELACRCDQVHRLEDGRLRPVTPA